MERVLPTAMVMGLIAGLLVAGYMNIFNVPVMEWAIDLEGKAALAEPAGDEQELPLSWATSLGAQRVGMTLGLAVVGVLCGAVFSGLYYLTRRATPGWSPWAWAAIAGLLGFWSVSMFTQLKFPLNPPGVGDEGTLLARQGLQFLVIAVSAVSAAAVLYAVGVVNRTSSGSDRWLRYASIGLAYAVVMLLLGFAVPNVRDAAPDWLPPALVIMFRTFTAIGHFLLWMGISLGTVGYLLYRQKGIHAYRQSTNTGARV